MSAKSPAEEAAWLRFDLASAAYRSAPLPASADDNIRYLELQRDFNAALDNLLAVIRHQCRRRVWFLTVGRRSHAVVVLAVIREQGVWNTWTIVERPTMVKDRKGRNVVNYITNASLAAELAYIYSKSTGIPLVPTTPGDPAEEEE